MKGAGKNLESFMEQMLPKQNNRLLLGNSQQNKCASIHLVRNHAEIVKSCSVYFVRVALKRKKERKKSWVTKQNACVIGLVLQWDMCHSVPSIYIWKSTHKPGFGISMVNKKASHSSFPRPATFSVPSPCAQENNPRSELL